MMADPTLIDVLNSPFGSCIVYFFGGPEITKMLRKCRSAVGKASAVLHKIWRTFSTSIHHFQASKYLLKMLNLNSTLLLFSKWLAQPPFHYFFGLLWLQNFKRLFLIHLCTDSLNSLSKFVLLIIVEVPIPLSKQYF